MSSSPVADNDVTAVSADPNGCNKGCDDTLTFSSEIPAETNETEVWGWEYQRELEEELNVLRAECGMTEVQAEKLGEEVVRLVRRIAEVYKDDLDRSIDSAGERKSWEERLDSEVSEGKYRLMEMDAAFAAFLDDTVPYFPGSVFSHRGSSAGAVRMLVDDFYECCIIG